MKNTFDQSLPESVKLKPDGRNLTLTDYRSSSREGSMTPLNVTSSEGRALRRDASPCRVISFTSGKGGVGKSNSVINIAISLAQRGRSVLILDADLSLANIDILLGLKPTGTLANVVAGECQLEDVLLEGPEGVSIIPAASGVESLTALSHGERMLLLEQIEKLASRFDYLLIDTQAGISADVLYFNAAAGEVICVITPEPTSLTDAYALIKLLARRSGDRAIGVLVNQAGSKQEAEQAYTKLSRAVTRYLPIRTSLVGQIPADATVWESVRAQRAVTEQFPTSQAALAWRKAADTLDQNFVNDRVKGGMQMFFKQILESEPYGV